MLEKIKILLGITDTSQDDLLQQLFEDATEDVLNWTNRSELPTSLESPVRQITVIRYNKLGVEGQNSHSEGGISRNFEDIPQSLQSAINQKRRAKLVTYHAAD